MSASTPPRPKWTQDWVKELTPEERAVLESLPLFEDDLPPGETEVVLIPPAPTSPPKTLGDEAGCALFDAALVESFVCDLVGGPHVAQRRTYTPKGDRRAAAVSLLLVKPGRPCERTA